MNQEERMKKLQAQNMPVNLNENQIKLDALVREHIQKNGSITSVEGPFSDMKKNLGFVEEYVKTDKGIQTKFYGCSYLFKGDLKRETIDSVTATKRVLMATIHQIMKGKMMFFSFRGFLEWFVYIYDADLKQKTCKQLTDFSPLPREIIKAGISFADKLPSRISFCGQVEEYREKVKRFFWCLGTFFQNDFAYYWRLQDPLVNLNKEKLRENPRKEIGRILQLLVDRENHIKPKLKLARSFIMLVLILPKARRIAKEYLLELDTEKIKPDEEDYYWSGRRHGYDFEGKSYKERMVWVGKMDGEKGHTIFGIC